MPAEHDPAIDVEGLTVHLGGRTVLDGLSFDLRPGGKAVVTGPSGSGKSTLLGCLLGFVQPAAGAIRIAGHDLDRHSVWHLRRQIAYVPQEPDLGDGSVREAIERPFHYRANHSLRDNLQRTSELMDRFALPSDLLTKPAAQLSGGEKQRVAIVRAILLDRPIFLLDEVSSALDEDNRQVVLDWFAAAEAAVLTVAHDPRWLDIASARIDLRPSPGAPA